MVDYMKNLRSELYSVSHRRNLGATELATKCGMSYENLRKILNKERKDLLLSSFLEICENIGIPPSKILEPELDEQKNNAFIGSSVLVIGNMEYGIVPKRDARSRS